MLSLTTSLYDEMLTLTTPEVGRMADDARGRARTGGRETGRGYHHGDLRRALIGAGLELLDDGGVEAVGLRAAARAAGVSHAAPARHFADAAAFVAAIAAAGYDQLAVAMEAARAEAPDPLSGFRATGLAYVAFALGHPNRFRVLSHPLVAEAADVPELGDASQRAFGVLRRAISDAQADGSVRAGDAETVALAAWSMVHGLAVLLVDGWLDAKGYADEPNRLAEAALTHLYAGLHPLG